MKTLIVLLCLLVAGTAWAGEECYRPTICVSGCTYEPGERAWDEARYALEKTRYEDCLRRKQRPKFYKVLDPDILIRANEIEAWKIEKGYNEKKDIPIEKCEARGFEKEWTVCVPGPREWVCNWICAERKWTVKAKWEGGWYDIKVFKTRQKAKDWLDRNGP